jgi:predicted permease
MTLLDDIRYGARLLLRAPGFTAAAVLTLALGIGAGTAVFSAVDTILRPAPQLAELIRISPLEDGRVRPVGPDELDAWRAVVPEHALAAYAVGAVNAGVESGGGEARHVERIPAAAVDDHYFDVVRTTPILGRAFGDGTDANVVLVSEEFWRTQLSARPDVVGSSVTVDGMPHTIVGVLPDEPRFPRSDTAIWRPLPPRTDGATVIGRVARTTPLAPLRARLETAQRARPAAKDGIRIDWFHDTLLTDRLRATASIGRVTVVFVLLIACANVANLIVARNAGRRAEFAARLALGASRGRLARQLLTESALVASLGGALGVGVALAVTNALMRAWQAIPDARPLAASVEFGTPMLLWALGGAAAATLVAGVIPAWHDTRLEPRSVLAEDGHATTASRGGANLQRTLVALQIAFAFALVTAAMLLARSFTLLHTADVGFEVEQVFTFRVAPGSGSGFDAALDARLGERLRSLPGVLAVGRATHVPLVTAPVGGEHRAEQHVRAMDDVGRVRELLRRMADAPDARDEDHPHRAELRHRLRVVAGAARHDAAREAQRRGRVAIAWRIRGSLGAGAFTCSSSKAIVVPLASPIFMASARMFSNSRTICASSRSRSSSEHSTVPGMTFGAPGTARIRPTVPTWRPGALVTTRFTMSMNRAAASIASCRWPIGVVPAWFAKPVTVTFHQRMPTMPSTMPIVVRSASSTPPCSMCSSK